MIMTEKYKILVKYIKDSNYYSVQAELMDKEKVKKSAKKDALVRRLLTRFSSYAKLNRSVPSEAVNSLTQLSDPEQFANTLSSYIILKISMKQKLLEIDSTQKLLDKFREYLSNIENTSLYFSLLRCLRYNPEERVFLYI